jgi:hypothetical protein
VVEIQHHDAHGCGCTVTAEPFSDLGFGAGAVINSSQWIYIRQLAQGFSIFLQVPLFFFQDSYELTLLLGFFQSCYGALM